MASEGLFVSRALGHYTLQGQCEYVLGAVHYELGEYGPARARQEEALRLYRLGGYVRGVAAACQQLGRVAYREGHLEEARRRTNWSLRSAPWKRTSSVYIPNWTFIRVSNWRRGSRTSSPTDNRYSESGQHPTLERVDGRTVTASHALRRSHMRRLSWSGWLLAGVMLLQNVGTGLASPAAASIPSMGTCCSTRTAASMSTTLAPSSRCKSSISATRSSMRFRMPQPVNGRFSFRGVGPQFQPLRPNLNPDPFPGHS